MTLVEGQKLWLVYNDRRYGQSREVVVSKVGRKWADIGLRNRINVDTLIIDGDPSPGRCYPDRDAYEQSAYRARLWDMLRDRVSRQYRAPSDLTMDDILAAAKLLGIDLSTVEKPEQAS